MAQVQQWAFLQPLHNGGGRKTVIKLSPFGSTAPVAQTNEEARCQMGKCTGSTGFAALSLACTVCRYLQGTGCTWAEFSPASPLLLSRRREQMLGLWRGWKSSMHVHTLPTVWKRVLCSYGFGLALQSHNYFISFRTYQTSEICVFLRDLSTSWEMLIRFPSADVSLTLF